MYYRNFNLESKVSLLGFGAMRLPTKDGKIDYELADKMIELAYNSGVTYYDTAYFYHNGESERFLGKSLSRFPRNSYYIASKLPVGMINNIDDAHRIFNEQLTKLQKDYLDFYLLHGINKDGYLKAKNLGIITYLEELKKQGKIRHIGFSFHGSFEDFEYIINDYNFEFVQIQLNYMDVNHQQGYKGYEILAKMKIPVVVMEPVKGGSLAKLSSDVEEMFKSLRPNSSIASWAIRYVASQTGVMTLLSGMSTMEQVEDNIKTISNFEPLTKEEEQLIEKVSSIIRERILVPCTDCKYCMPCPKNVNIPKNFRILNELYRYDKIDTWPNVWGLGKEENLINCINCKKCEKKCPQGIKIGDIFKEFKEKAEVTA
jgi:hypothetical protein